MKKETEDSLNYSVLLPGISLGESFDDSDETLNQLPPLSTPTYCQTLFLKIIELYHLWIAENHNNISI